MIKAVNHPNGLRTEYVYDNMNRLTSLINKRGGATLSQFGYEYDGTSNIISVNASGQTITYQYDAFILHPPSCALPPNLRTVKMHTLAWFWTKWRK